MRKVKFQVDDEVLIQDGDTPNLAVVIKVACYGDWNCYTLRYKDSGFTVETGAEHYLKHANPLLRMADEI